ncbi:MAG: ParB N-terminal domain-containing protein [Gemmataceae bacterium]
MSQETITIGDTTYTILFPDLLRPLSGQEREDLKDSILNYGINVAVVIDESNGIIDGANRTRIVAELGLPVLLTRKVEGLSAEDKRRLALSLNLDRRHLSKEDRAQLVEARRLRVQEARAAAKSLRTIAQEEGVSESLIRKDLAASPAHHFAGDTTMSPAAQEQPSPPVPAKIQGRDGKHYPSGNRQVKSLTSWKRRKGESGKDWLDRLNAVSAAEKKGRKREFEKVFCRATNKAALEQEAEKQHQAEHSDPNGATEDAQEWRARLNEVADQINEVATSSDSRAAIILSLLRSRNEIEVIVSELEFVDQLEEKKKTTAQGSVHTP